MMTAVELVVVTLFAWAWVLAGPVALVLVTTVLPGMAADRARNRNRKDHP